MLFVRRPVEEYLSELGLNRGWVDSFVVEELLDFLGDIHVVGEVAAADVRWGNDAVAR